MLLGGTTTPYGGYKQPDSKVTFPWISIIIPG